MATMVKFFNGREKVKELTSVGYLPVDLKPMKDSRHLVSSGAVAEGISTAVTGIASGDNSGKELHIPNPTVEYEEGEFYYLAGTFNLCTAYSASEAVFTPYSICEALNYLKGLIDDLGE